MQSYGGPGRSPLPFSRTVPLRSVTFHRPVRSAMVGLYEHYNLLRIRAMSED